MKKYWGIIGTTLVALTLAGCGNNSQSKSSDTKVKTHKVAKASHHKKTAKTTTKKTTTKNSTSTAFSGKNYASSWIDSVSGVFFKGDQFIWKYTSPVTINSDNSSSSTSKMMIMQGTYNYDSSSKVITLNIANQSKTYTGKSMSLDKYQYETVAAPSAPNTVKMQFSNDNGTDILEILNGDFVNSKLQDVNQDSKLNYDNILNQFSVSKVDSSMQKQVAGINSADDFQTFMTKCFTDNGSDVSDLIMKSVANDGKDYDIYSADDPNADTPEKTIKAKYTLHVNNPVGGSEKYILGEDNNIYWSPEEQTHNSLEPGFNSKYHQEYGNN